MQAPADHANQAAQANMHIAPGLPEHLKVCQTRYGVMLANVHDLYISRSLLVYGEFSAAELELLLPLLQPDDWVLDVGANIGTHTLAFARAVPRGLVLAFEPQRQVFQMLNANVALNALGNVSTLQQGVGAQAGQLTIPPLDHLQEGNFGAFPLTGWTQGESVAVTTIDNLQLPRAALLKIDVEGMELEVLQGAAETIKRHQPLLYVENDRVEKSPALIQALMAMNYDLWWHVVPYFRAENFNRQPENIFGNVVGINMLAAPKSRALTITATNTEKVTHADDHPIKRAQLQRNMQMM